MIKIIHLKKSRNQNGLVLESTCKSEMKFCVQPTKTQNLCVWSSESVRGHPYQHQNGPEKISPGFTVKPENIPF